MAATTRIHAQLVPRECDALAAFFTAAVTGNKDLVLALQLCNALAVPAPRVGALGVVVAFPQALAVLPDDTIVVAERDAAVVRVVDVDGTTLTTIGAGQLNLPMSVAVLTDGNVAVCDLGRNAVFVFSLATGDLVSTIADRRLVMPKGCVELWDGSLLISSSAGGTGQLFLWTRDNELVELHTAVQCDRGQLARIRAGAMAIDPATRRRVAVIDEASRCVWELRYDGQRPSSEMVARVAVADVASEGVAFMPDGSLLVCDTLQCVIRHYDTSFVLRAQYGAGRGTDELCFDYPTAVAPLGDAHFVAADKRNNRLQILTTSRMAALSVQD